MSRIFIKKLSGENALESLREEWRNLFAASEASPFLCLEWLLTWYKFFGDGKTLFILKAYRDNRLIGALPLCLQQKRFLGMKIRRLGFIGGEIGGADYLDLIAKSEDKPEILQACFDFLKNETSFDVINLENLAENSAIAQHLKNSSAFGSKEIFKYSASTTSVCPRIDLKDGWEAVLRQSKRASNFKRKLKQLEKMPGFEYRSVTSAPETPEAFERFFALHEKRWKNSGGSELCGHPRLYTFQSELIKALSQTGLLRFEEIWVEGKCRSSVYGLDDGRAFYYYNSGYDLDWANYSVGLVLIGLSVKNAIERGNLVYDFLRGDETYKFDWANGKTELISATLSRNTFPAFAFQFVNQAFFVIKNFSKSALPDSFTEPVKNWRREWKRNYQLSALKAGKTR